MLSGPVGRSELSSSASMTTRLSYPWAVWLVGVIKQVPWIGLKALEAEPSKKTVRVDAPQSTIRV